MKKILGSLICAGALVSSVNAYEHVEYNTYFQEKYSHAFRYENYNNPNDIVYGAWGGFLPMKKGGNTKELEGRVGKNISYYTKDDLELGVNILGGLVYYNVKTNLVDINSFGIAATINISGTYNKSILYGAEFSYTELFGDFDGHFVRYMLNAGYKFDNNLYVKTTLGFKLLGVKVTEHSDTEPFFGFGVGYSF